MRQQRWIKFLASYDFDIQYTLGKGNRVSDVLSHKHSSIVSMMLAEWDTLETLSLCDIRDRVPASNSPILLFSLEARPSLLDRNTDAQRQDPDLMRLIWLCKFESRDDELRDFSIDIHGFLRKNNRLIMPRVSDLRRDIIDDCHHCKYTI